MVSAFGVANAASLIVNDVIIDRLSVWFNSDGAWCDECCMCVLSMISRKMECVLCVYSALWCVGGGCVIGCVVLVSISCIL